VRDDVHLERSRTPCDFLSDAPESCKSQRFSANFFTKETFFVPLALLHRRIGRGYLSGKCQQQRHRQFRHTDAVRTWGIHDDDAACACLVDVNVVDAGACARDGSKRRRSGNHLFGNFRGASYDERVGVCKIHREISR
jgi:hypothetical protein